MLFNFRIQIARISNPPVWRKVTVPSHFSFHKFHLVIQAAFSWEDNHLYQFSEKGYASFPGITVPSEMDLHEVMDSRKTKLSEVFYAKGQRFVYIYDFGDDWIHNITVEDITEISAIRADCIAGKGKCPPEDCGGAWGYQALKDALEDHRSPEYKKLCNWLGLKKGQQWDANTFDLQEARKAVGKV